MSHHASGPNFGFPRGDARLDMTDLYAFTKPGDPGKSILILNVHPSFRLDSPEPTTKEPFAPGALYEFKIDTDGDAVADICYGAQFASSEDGRQTATLRRTHGARAAGFCDDGEILIEAASVSIERETLVTKAGDYHFFFGWRSDPFFFDVNGNFNNMQFTGDDFFKDKNVCSIVIELPNSALGPNEVGIWARTVDKTEAGWIQADRGGRPLQAVFLPGEQKDAYLSGEPADDARFIGVFAHELEHSGGYMPEGAIGVARKLLPDILSYDPRQSVRYPDNGRTLTDDVVDVFFSIYANRNVTDKVGSHGDLLDKFPYLWTAAWFYAEGHEGEFMNTQDSRSKKWRVVIPVIIIALVVGLYWFRPERLVINRRVDEAFPAINDSATQILESGTFHSGTHPTEGTATIYRIENGSRVLRFTNFKTSNGPDVHIYMVAAEDARDDASVEHAEFVDLGLIKGNIGDQNYTLASDLELAKYRTVSVWCKRFSKNFGAAPLMPAAQSTR